MDRYRNLASYAYQNEFLGRWADFLQEGAMVSTNDLASADFDDGDSIVGSTVTIGVAYRVSFVQKNTSGDILRFGLETEGGVLVVTGCLVAGFYLAETQEAS